jgi:hypothetical protein
MLLGLTNIRRELCMVFLVSYRKKFDGAKLQANLRKTFFAEHPSQPTAEEIEQLVDFVSQGEFAIATIQLQKCVGFDAAELSKCGVAVYRFKTKPTECTS